jgi:metal-responsive CopG/Arc/MetJ family transcriptional regulator
MRTLVDIPEAELHELSQIGKKKKVSRAAVIREAVTSYLDRNRPKAMDDAFGIWRHKKFDSLEYQRKLRDEW